MARSTRETTIAFLAYAILVVAVFRPTASDLAHTVPAYQGASGDAVLYLWATSHVSDALWQDPAHLFDGPILHPTRRTLALSDHMIGQAVLGLPIWLATRNPMLEFNLLVLASYALGATGAWALARFGFGLGGLASWAAGLTFAFTPYRYQSPAWLQVLWTAFVPLAILAWLRFVRRPSAARWAVWVGCWFAHSLMGMYLALYFGVALGALAAAAAWATPEGRSRRVVLGSAAALAVVAVAFAPIAWPYVALRAAHGTARAGGLDTPLSFFLPGPGTLLGRLLGITPGAWFGPGASVAILAAIGLASPLANRTHPAGRLTRTTATTGIAVTLLLVIVPLRWQQLLPGFDMIRATNRAFYLTLVFLGPCVAMGVERIAARAHTARTRTVVTVVLLALLTLDTGEPPRERKRLPLEPEFSPGVRALGTLPRDAVVYEAVNDPEGLSQAMYHAIFHRRRLAGGYTGFVTPGAEYANHVLHRFPDDASLQLLHRIGVGWVLARYPSLATADAAVARIGGRGGTVTHRAPREVLFDVRGIAPRSDGGAAPMPRSTWSATVPIASDHAALLRDGAPDTAWSVSAPASIAPHVTLTLDTVRLITGLRLQLARDHAAWLYGSTIEVSEDGVAWAPTAPTVEPQPLATYFDAPAPVTTFDVRIPPTRARYVRITNPAFAEWSATLAKLPTLVDMIAHTNPTGAFWAGSWQIAELDVLAPAQ